LLDVQQFLRGDWLKNALLALVNQTIRMLQSSVGGFLSVFGFLISLVIIPIYLFYFLIDARYISATWQDYLPLKNSRFKTELVSALTEINGYVIAFFRGQLLVSVINGGLTALGLMIVGLDFGILIGLVLCFLGLIPYLGILLCWIPAVIIATVQQGGTWIPPQPGWLFPVVVTGIFVLVQKIDSFYITPKVVQQRVGLHPLTVIVSIFSWSLLIGGLLGAILAVPLTATLKVLLRRYAWSGVSLNYMICAYVLQWGLLCQGFWTNVRERYLGLLPSSSFPAIPVNLDAMIYADYTVATVLISFGALLGRLSPTQALWMVSERHNTPQPPSSFLPNLTHNLSAPLLASAV
jgi:hypothetical protein